jgi:C4-dicarboxylate-specific signal transduction histidine kinase
VKSLSRASRSLAWGVVAVAAVCIPWGTVLISSANEAESEATDLVAAVRRLDHIERYTLELGGLARGAAPAAAGDPHAYEEWIAGVRAIASGEPALRESLGRVEAGVARLRDLAGGDGSAADPAERSLQVLDATSAILAGSQAMKDSLRKELNVRTSTIFSKWTQLQVMAILSCALAIALALVLFAYDRIVAERERVEAEERTLRAELAHVGRLSMVGEMGTKVAHELNQPLGAIHNYLAGCVRRLQQREGDPAEMIQALKAAADEATRASSIIQGLRDFVRNSQPRSSTVEINDLVREVLPLLAIELRESRIEPELRLAEGLEPVLVDRIQIGQVLVNLIRNALEAMAEISPSKRKLVVTTRQADEHHIEVAVEDTGCGLAPDVLSNLFQPFHTTKPKGMGMGLAISRTIVEAHEGRILAEPRPGQGAIFRFQLPCPSMVIA